MVWLEVILEIERILNPDRLQYEMVFTDSDVVAFNHIQSAKDFIEEKEA